MEGPESLHPYGTALPSLDEDTLFKEKPTRVEDQIVTDENGKRRFHGAFTGGFSAGYWNTVGSQEGWTPQSFKSSRAEKAMKLQQKPTDFMDDEDLGEFGFAPQRLQVREEYGGADTAGTSNEIRKRKLQLPSSFGGGESDVLNNIFLPVKTTVGVKILKSMGWRQGQGIGPRQTKKEKKQAAAFNKREMYVLQNYGCATNGKTDEVDNDIVMDVKGSTDEDDSDEEITFAPDDYDAYDSYLHKPKENYFGLGYAGLSRTSILSDAKEMPAQHINLFGPLEIMGKNNKKLSITGQGFGVGALEEEDDDIYQREDMTKYDFSLEDKSGRKNKRKTKTETSIQDSFILEGFIAETNNAVNAEQVFDVELTRDWKPRNWAERKSRFAPLNEKQLHALEKRRKQLTKPALTPKERSQILEAPDTKTAPEQEKINLEKIKEKYTKRENKTKELLERISAKSSGFVLGGIIAMDGTEQNNKEVIKSPQDVATKESGLFQPFVYDEAKQKRYDDFIAANPKTDQDISELLRSIQPLHLSEWDREMEKQEFIQAKKLYKPLEGLMANRFVSETTVQAEITTKETKKLEERTAVIVVRTKTVWKPASLLCKRYNIADPFGGIVGGDDKQQKHKNSKLSVFDYLEGSVNTKSNFITPVVIPKHMDNAKGIIKTAIESKNQNFTNTKNSVEINEPSTSAIAEANAINNDVIESDASRRLAFVPKTELEKRVVETRDLPIEEKRDIFKSIFADSDDDDVDMPEVEGIANLKTYEEEKQAIGQLEMNKTAASINLLRNTSPPRGIFAALFKTNINETNEDKSIAKGNGEGDDYEPPPKIKFISKGQRHEDGNVLNVDGPKETLCENVYGPAIPTSLLISQSSANTHSDTHAKVDQTADKRISYKGVEIVEQWVEKRQESSMDTTDDSSSTISSKKKYKKNKKSKKSKKSYDKKSKKSKKKKVKQEKEKHKSSKSKKR